jgi:tellurite resistance protein TerC
MELLVDFFVADWLGKPVWMWAAFLSIVLALLAFDLGILHKDDKELGVRESLNLSVFYILIAMAFGGWVWWYMGPQPGMEYFTGYFIEKSLSIDNIFVISLIFGFFAIPRKYQYRALLWGIIAVIVLRGVMIGVGAALVQNFAWVLYIFAAFLIFTGIKMLMGGEEETDLSKNKAIQWLRMRMRVSDEQHGDRFFVKKPDPKSGKMVSFATPLFLALVVINIADLVFAVDSVPAIFAITTDTFVVYTANIMAILGLRALYFALAAMIARFHYLKYALAAVLILIGSKIFIADMLGLAKFPAWLSLTLTLGLIAGGVVYSLWKTRDDPKHGAKPQAAE